MRRLQKSGVGLLVITLIFVIDQLSKWAIVEMLFKKSELGFVNWLTMLSQDRLEFISIPLLPFFNLVMVWNKGVSFGLFQNDSLYGVMALAGLALIVSIGFFVAFLRSDSKLLMVASLMVVGGALGNIWDRVRFGAVVDFLDFHVAGWHYPAFNVADSCIVVGIMLFLFKTVFIDGKSNS